MNIRKHQVTIGSIGGETQPCGDVNVGGMTADFGTVAVSSFAQVTKLTSWRGTGTGCLVGGVVKNATCASTDVTGTTINALASMDLNRWRSDLTVGSEKYYVFCTLSTIANVFVGVNTLRECPATDSLGNTMSQCGDHCYTTPKGYKAGVCPYSLWKLADTSTVATAAV